MRLLETFNLNVGKQQRRGLEHHDKKTPELSFDIHMKRRKYVEELVAKSLESEGSGETDSAKKHFLQKSEPPRSRSLSMLARRHVRAKRPELRKWEQRIDNGGGRSSAMSKGASEAPQKQPVHDMRKISSIWKDTEDLAKTWEATGPGNDERRLEKATFYGNTFLHQQESLSKLKPDSTPQTTSTTPSQSLEPATNLNIKTESVVHNSHVEICSPNNVADHLRLNSSRYATQNSSLTEEQPVQRPVSKDASRDFTHGVQPRTTYLVDETASKSNSKLTGGTSSFTKTLSSETEAQDFTSRSVSAPKEEHYPQREHDQELEFIPDFLKHAPGQHSSTSTKSDTTTPQSTTIHILGMGPIGKYIAHSLSRLEHGPRVTLLMHRPLMIQEWHDEGAAIRLLKDGEILVATGFHVESSADFGKRRDSRERFAGFGEALEHTVEQPDTVIDHLVVTTDPNTTVTALSSIKHRIRDTSTICLVQDGLGMIETLNSTLFTDPQRRPTYVLASISHDLVSTDRRFTIVEKSSGEIFCSKIPRTIRSPTNPHGPAITRTDFSWSPESKYLVGMFYRVPELNTSTLGHKSFYKAQLEKLAVSAVIGPVSVAFDCRNDQLLYNYPASMMMKMLLKEISNIITSLPELRNMSVARKDFSARKLEYRVLSSIGKTGMNFSRMLRAVRAGERTDIEFINGYLIQRAVDLGIHHPVNQLLMTIVRGKHLIKKRESDGYIPFGRS